jgi:hypothetical protein
MNRNAERIGTPRKPAEEGKKIKRGDAVERRTRLADRFDAIWFELIYDVN